MEDRCVCCGEIIPEGRQICPKCRNMSIEKAIEVLEATPLFRMEHHHTDRSELGEAFFMAVEALKEKLAVEDDMK